MKLNSPRDTRYMQYLSAVVATLSTASAAMHLTWPSPTLPLLTSSNSPIGIQITGEEGSWVTSSVVLGSIVGCAIGAWLVETFGRKSSLLMAAGPLIFPWIVIVFAESVIVLCAARFIAGMGWGVIMTCASIYNGEIAEKDIRGKLGTTFNILKLTGNLYVLSVGPFLSYTALALSCTVLPIIFAALFSLMPESPYYLIKKGRIDRARKNLIRLSSRSSNSNFIDERLKEIQMTVDEDMKNRSTVWEMFSNPEYRKSLIIITGETILLINFVNAQNERFLGVKTLQLLSGSTAIEAYMQTIIEASNSSISPEVSSIIAGVIQMPAAVLAAIAVDKVGRRPLMIISALGCALALVSEGVYFYLKDAVRADVSSISWLPTTALLLYLVMNPLGIYTMSWILLGELFATNIKATAISFFTVYGGVIAFLVTKFFQPISDKWGLHVSFWIFASVCVLGDIFVFFVQPETKGKTFLEIQEELKGRVKVKNNNCENT